MQWAFLSYVLPEFIQKRAQKTTLIYQTHEWLAGYGLILMKLNSAYSFINK